MTSRNAVSFMQGGPYKVLQVIIFRIVEDEDKFFCNV